MTDGSLKASAALTTGVVIKGVGGIYTVRTADGSSVSCAARGKFRHEGECPYPGDCVRLSCDRDAWAIDSILPRANRLIRPTAANVTHLVAVIPACRPKPDTVTADKLIAAAEDKDIVPVIVINKRDIDPVESARLASIYRRAGFDVFEISAATGEGVDTLGAYLAAQGERGRAGEEKCDEAENAGAGADDNISSAPLAVFSGASGAVNEGASGDDNISSAPLVVFSGASGAGNEGASGNDDISSVPLVVFSGASGAGKSTLMTGLYPELRLKTGEVSRKSERGRHTTRTAELFDVGGYFVADTPGFTMLDFAEFNFIPTENLAFSFREFLPYVGKCRYTKCTHTKEEGCAILAAVASGDVPRERHANYAAIREEMLKTPEWKRRKR